MINLFVSISFLIFFEVAYANPDQPPPIDTYSHLTPIQAYDSNGYQQAVYESLIGSKNAEIWMVILPSFSNEYAIILHEKVEYKKEGEKLVLPLEIVKKEWLLERAEAKQKIWKSIEANDRYAGDFDRVLVLDIHSTEDVIRNSIKVNKDDYEYIIKAWEAALSKTGYPEIRENNWLDGVIYQFHARAGNLFGETYPPYGDTPMKLVTIGKILENIVSTKEEKRAELLIEANTISKEILNETP